MLISVTGPSGIGKGFIKKAVCEHFLKIRELPWTTTRPARKAADESNRVFVSLEKFQTMTTDGEIILAHSLFGHHYGIEKRLLEIDSGQTMFTELRVENISTIKSLGISLVAIGLIPASLEFLRKRLEAYRGTESPEEIELRLVSAEVEIQQILDNREMFLNVIKVAEENEQQIVAVVLEILTNHLERSVNHEP